MNRASAVDRAELTIAGVRRGFTLCMGLAVTSAPFGIAFGAAAAAQNVPGWAAIVMSACVFAGGAQFAALDFLSPLALAPLLLATFAVNARHLVMGASLAPWMRTLPPATRYSVAAFLSDVNWAIAREAHEKGERDVGVLVGGGLALWGFWVAGTILGALVGTGLGDPARFGLDLIFVAFFAAMLAGQWRPRRDWASWLSAGLGAFATSFVFSPGWPAIAGALVGGAAGMFIEDA
jgi:4-azaleucine resistance transporter AzlC